MILPVEEKLLVRVIEGGDATTTAGLIVMHDDDGPESARGMVEAAGPEANYEVGDVVIFRKWAADAVRVGPDTLYFVESNVVLGLEELDGDA